MKKRTVAVLMSVVVLSVLGAGIVIVSGCGGGETASQGTGPVVSVSPTDLMPPADFNEAVADAGNPDGTCSPTMIGSDRRMAVVYECWYALRRSYL